MSDTFPAHRLDTILASLQAGIVLLGTVFIRFATTESLQGGFYRPAPFLAMWTREWGYLFLPVPAVWVVTSAKAARRDEQDRYQWLRAAIGVLVTIALGFLYWWLWTASTMRPRMIMEL